MPQTAIPCVIMRGGTSKGPYFKLADLPEDREALTWVLLAVMGSPDTRQIDGIGGAQWLTSKVAMVGPTARDDAELDYLFGQVLVDRGHVDYAPNCGNMTSGVAPFAIEAGMIAARDPETVVRIHNVNTGALIEATVQTPGGQVTYEGGAAIDGAPGTAAPVMLYFSRMVGSITGTLLPTGRPRDTVGGIDVSCVDVAVPMITMRAADLGKTGYESKAELDADKDLLARLETIRVEASERMGMGDPTGRVVPKLCLIAAPRSGGSINARYFVPQECHATFPLVGGMCLAAAAVTSGTVTDGIARISDAPEQSVVIEHPAGQLETMIEFEGTRASPEITRVGFMRTARRLMQGTVYVPAAIWGGRR
ncbi:MAG TPA: 4-oxalomesaconate tautomerase [Alphaproteobacteria bacterium]|nr:4-oxalomesaconate tautomerase [Alphaproteobacteria bacterium]